MNEDVSPRVTSSYPYLVPLLAVFLIEALVVSSVGREEIALLAETFVGASRDTAVQSEAPASDPMHFPPEPQLTAHAYVVRPLNRERPLLKRREWKQLPSASITKLLTALIAVQELSAEEFVTFSAEAKAAEEKISTAKVGEGFLRDHAIGLALITSGNDAAYALAQAVGSRRGALSFEEAIVIFVALMNERGGALGLANSHFQNPAGLDHPQHFSSAEDLARLLAHLWHNYPELAAISRTAETEVRSREGWVHHLQNTNQLLAEFPAILASKTGRTDNAKGALAMLYPARDRSQSPVLIVILGSEDRFGDGRKIIQWLEGAVPYVSHYVP